MDSASPSALARLQQASAEVQTGIHAGGPMSPEVLPAANFLRGLQVPSASVGIILGTGLGAVSDAVATTHTVPYDLIPHFRAPTAIGHQGQLRAGTLAGQPVLMLEGRSHLYEGITAVQAAFPVQVLHAMGVRLLIVTNAAGGMRPDHQVGDIMVIADQINFLFCSPFSAGKSLGLNTPDTSSEVVRHPCEAGGKPLFSGQWQERALSVAQRLGVPASSGVYAAVLGPNYETRAEYRMFRQLGADAIGMSTVPEVQMAAALGMRVLGFSTITNVCCPDALDQTSGEAVAHAARSAAPRIASLLNGLLGEPEWMAELSRG